MIDAAIGQIDLVKIAKRQENELERKVGKDVVQMESEMIASIQGGKSGK